MQGCGKPELDGETMYRQDPTREADADPQTNKFAGPLVRSSYRQAQFNPAVAPIHPKSHQAPNNAEIDSRAVARSYSELHADPPHLKIDSQVQQPRHELQADGIQARSLISPAHDAQPHELAQQDTYDDPRLVQIHGPKAIHQFTVQNMVEVLHAPAYHLSRYNQWSRFYTASSLVCPSPSQDVSCFHDLKTVPMLLHMQRRPAKQTRHPPGRF
jgi:hypothetical protein